MKNLVKSELKTDKFRIFWSQRLVFSVDSWCKALAVNLVGKINQNIEYCNI